MRPRTRRSAAAVLLILTLAAAAPGLLRGALPAAPGGSPGGQQPSQEPPGGPEGAPEAATSGTVGAITLPTSPRPTPAVILARHAQGVGHVLEWVRDATRPSVAAAAPAPDTLYDAALAGATPRLLERVDNRSVAIRHFGANDSEEVQVAPPGQAILTKGVHYGVTASGVEAIGCTLLLEAAPLAHTVRVHLRPSGENWRPVTVPPPAGAGWSALRDMAVTGDDVHLLVVGPAGTYYARVDAASGAFEVAPELVLAPKQGSGVGLAAAGDGRVAILAAEPQEETDAAARGAEVLGARVAVRSVDGAWSVSHVGRTHQGVYGDIRLEPTLRVLLYDWRMEDVTRRLVAYAPADVGGWREVARMPDGPARPVFLPGTPYVVVAPHDTEVPLGYELVAVE